MTELLIINDIIYSKIHVIVCLVDMQVTINYLLNTLGKSYAETVATIDLGGASVQMAYAISDENAAKAPHVAANETYLLQKNLKGTNYNLYVHRYFS